ncbi:MAG: alpha/beta fold hydrolase [Thermoanaerobaculia bacterium]|nr:alpha/beta fold hydrolase [Thermoanaerobaculia bacterium]
MAEEVDSSHPTAFEFGPYRLEVAEHRLLHDGRPISLRAKVFDTLVELVSHAGALLSKEALIEAVWPDTLVEEGNLSHNISALRKALAHGEGPYIETVPKRGYRFVAPVAVVGESAATPHYREPVVRIPAEDEPPAPPQDIRFCLTPDGVQLAYSTVGSGPALVKTANWLNHLEFDFESPVWRHVIRAMSRDRMLVRYDERGNGLSDWNAEDLSFERFVDDLETVVDALGLERFPLFGISQGCAVSVAYAVRHPDRVSHLVLHGGYAVGWRLRGRPEDVARREALETLILQGWGLENPAFRQVFTSLYVPDANEEQMRWFNDLQRISASPENAVRLWEVLSRIDVRDLLGSVRTPTLVLHSRNDGAVPFENGRYLAAHIPGARFVPLESRCHLILEQDPAWPVFLDSVRRFLSR